MRSKELRLRAILDTRQLQYHLKDTTQEQSQLTDEDMSLYPLLIVDKHWSYTHRSFHHAKGRLYAVTTVAISAIGFLGGIAPGAVITMERPSSFA